MENIQIVESVYKLVGILQHVFVPLFAILTLVGLFYFNVSFKNPIKRRIAFLLTFFGPVGFVLFLFGPTILISELYMQVPTNESGEGIEVMAEWANSARSPIYYIFTTVALPILAVTLVIGTAMKYMAFRAPATSRIGTGVLICSTVLWVLIETGPSIFNVLTTL